MDTMREEFATFVEAAPPRRRARFQDVTECPLARFGRARETEPGLRIGGGNCYYSVQREDGRVLRTVDVLSTQEDMSALAESKTYGELARRPRANERP